MPGYELSLTYTTYHFSSCVIIRRHYFLCYSAISSYCVSPFALVWLGEVDALLHSSFGSLWFHTAKKSVNLLIGGSQTNFVTQRDEENLFSFFLSSCLLSNTFGGCSAPHRAPSIALAFGDYSSDYLGYIALQEGNVTPQLILFLCSFINPIVVHLHFIAQT